MAVLTKNESIGTALRSVMLFVGSHCKADRPCERVTYARKRRQSNLGWRYQLAAIIIPTLFLLGPTHAGDITIPSGKKTVVYVQSDDVLLASGPSKEHYATQAVGQGVALDAYLKTEDGWIGVRPPTGSFSWIQAVDAYLLPGGTVIEITNPKAVSWIGTQFGKAKQYGWQVELNQGEQLTVVGEATRQDEHGNQALWYKVKPPAGEYRWVHESSVTLDPGEVKKVASATKGSVPQRDSAQETAAVEQADGSVVTAAYQEEVVAQEVLSGDVFDDPMSVPSTVPGGSVSEVVDGGIVYEEGMPAPATGFTRGMFSGWHAFEFDDDGLHFRLLENRLGKRGAMTDPLEWDPYSLTMPKRVNASAPTQVPAGITPRRTGVHERNLMQGNSGYQPPQPLDGAQPWRHPSTLRANRMNGFAGASSEPLQGRSRREVMENIRRNVDGLGGSLGSLVEGVGDRLRGDAGVGGSGNEYAAGADGAYAAGTRGADEAEAARLGYRSSGDATLQNDSPLLDERFGDPGAYAPYDAGRQGVDWYGVTREATRTGVGESAPNQSANPSGANSSSRDAAFVSPELRALQVRLSEMVSQPPGLWNLPSIVERARYFVSNGQSALERGQARLLLERVAEFENHARRTAFIPGVNYRADNRSVPSTTPAANYRAPVQTAGFTSAGQSQVQAAGYQAPATASYRTAPTYDATGYLVPVMGGGLDQPSHALADERGAIIAYVTGLPGMNLDLYLNKPIGVVGLRGFLPKLQKGHVQVERVVEFK